MKKLFFVSGLPRSGSTLLMNILGQNPDIHVTPTSGLADHLINIRNTWDKNVSFRAMDRNISEQKKHNILKTNLYGYFNDIDETICIDKSRTWPNILELLNNILDNDLKVLITVRDLRDVLASFEKIYRKSISKMEFPFPKNEYFKSNTSIGRIEILLSNGNLLGRSYNGIMDAITRGWRNKLFLVDYSELTKNPNRTLKGIYEFLDIEEYSHDFNNIEQITYEDDYMHGFFDGALHSIQNKISYRENTYLEIYDDFVLNNPLWKQIENDSQFWKKL